MTEKNHIEKRLDGNLIAEPCPLCPQHSFEEMLQKLGIAGQRQYLDRSLAEDIKNFYKLQDK